jgi:opacity protein-like surface antigen
MSSANRYLLLASLACLLTGAASAQESPDTNRKVAGGGISVSGWQGKIDADAEKAGQTVSDAKLAGDGKTMQVTTGPAITYWNPKNVAKGDYTVSATFTEPKFMNLNTHPHPYGIVIAGSGLGTADQSYIYCAAYGNGNFIVRGFGPEAFQLNGRREANDAVHKAAGIGQPVTQEIAMQVKGDKVSCIINGTVVKTLEKADLVTAGKLKSTDGVYGIRFAHNTDATVSNLKVTKP